MAAFNDYVLTLDVDWGPDFAIEYAAQVLVERNVKATWFLTHDSAAVERLKESSHLFEFGVHPNLLPGSTHGQSEDAVLTHVMAMVPNAVSMRTHGLYQSSNFLAKAAGEYGIAIDVSLFLPRAANLTPHRLRWGYTKLWRLPYFWEDDSEMFEDDPIWSLSDERLAVPGLRIFDFHPIHLLLNTNKFETYSALKQELPVSQWDAEFVAKHANKLEGPRDLFLGLAEELSERGRQIKELISDGGRL
jgi:hypothetical protein